MKRLIVILLAFTFYSLCLNAQVSKPDIKTAYGLIERILPGCSKNFEVKSIPKENGTDVFEVYPHGKKIVLAGNNGVSVASALNYYLKNFCNFELTWNGPGHGLPTSFPVDFEKVRKVTPHKYRYYLNYCTFSYTMAWWDWERWEKEIDWMALNGINMPLSITGQEAIWRTVYHKLGLTDEELEDFFVGPAYFGWFYMNNMDSYGGPLPQSWMENHRELQKMILKRESELGMIPVLPAFTGHIPKGYVRKYPEVQIDSVKWSGQKGYSTYMLNPNDPLFAKIGKLFLEEQQRVYGTSHYYSSDIFNELLPPSGDTSYLARTSESVYNSMNEVDSQAVWVMQGWLFVSADGRKFWTADRMKAFLGAVPDNKMVVLELYSENRPRWRDTEAYYGKSWVWNMLHNFGGNIGMYGKAPVIASEPSRVLKDKKKGNLSGIGLTMEGTEQNPIIYHLMLDNVWNTEPINLNEWVKSYITRRYGICDINALNAWNVLIKTVYKNNRKDQGPAESMLTSRPTFNMNAAWHYSDLVYYENRDFVHAWTYMIKAAENLFSSNGFQYDLVDVTRQAMANYGTALHRQLAYTYYAGDIELYEVLYNRFLDLISDMDKLLRTRPEFLMGKWVETAKSWGTTPAEKRLYEINARNLVTIWGRPDCIDISDYSCRQWSGLLNSYYKGRWNEFFRLSLESLKNGDKWDEKKFLNYITTWSWEWVNRVDEMFPTQTYGDPISVSKEMYDKYFGLISRSEVATQNKNEH